MSVIAFLFCLLLIANYILYETWGSNENFYIPQNGQKVKCDINLLQKPSNCRTIIDNELTVIPIEEWPNHDINPEK